MLHSGATAWIEGRAIPDVASVHLPDSLMGELVHTAYVEQTSLGWNLLFRGFWSISWRKAQEYEFSQSPFHRGYQDNDNGECWSGRAQAWMFNLFDLAWGMRNATEHGADVETQRLIRLTKSAGVPFAVFITLVSYFPVTKGTPFVTRSKTYFPNLSVSRNTGSL